jgi:glycosyltransferase involved in cell wall biosynthesis
MTRVVSDSASLVSVVIPSRHAGADLFRAIASVRKQTFLHIEIIVVLDNASPSEETLERLERSVEKVLRPAEPVGGSAARNLGISAASGDWIALLDDDDEWVETKLQRQMDLAATLSDHAFPVISTRVLVQQGEEQRTWPFNRPPATGSGRISEYLFCISSPTRRGEGFVQTSTLLASKRLFEAVPFKDGLKIHQDWDWLLRASAERGFYLDMVWDPLTIYYLNTSGSSVSQTKKWRLSFDWATGNPLISKRGYSYFLATVVARNLEVLSLPRVLVAFFSRGVLELRSTALFLLFFSVRDKYRLPIARMLRKGRNH